jgi:DNA mismatch repair ATPase MutS
LESGEFRPGVAQQEAEAFQPMLIAKEHQIVEELRQLDVNSLTPLDALTTLYSWQKQVQGGKGTKRTRAKA